MNDLFIFLDFLLLLAPKRVYLFRKRCSYKTSLSNKVHFLVITLISCLFFLSQGFPWDTYLTVTGEEFFSQISLVILIFLLVLRWYNSSKTGAIMRCIFLRKGALFGCASWEGQLLLPFHCCINRFQPFPMSCLFKIWGIPRLYSLERLLLFFLMGASMVTSKRL